MRNEDQFIGGDFTWFTAVVEDIHDPDNLNRVKVRCHGWHSTNTDIVSTENLPWATVMMPNTSAGVKGSGGNHHLQAEVKDEDGNITEPGSWVVGFFRDGPSAQDPIIMGSIATQTNGTQDIPTESSVDNKVYKSKAGHLIEIDNTSDAETLRVTHAKGAKITIDKDNNLSITNSGTTKIESDGIITIKSNIKTTII